MKRSVAMVVLAFSLAACDAFRSPPEYARTDSLAGFDLAMRRPDVEQRAQAMGTALECDSLRPMGSVRRMRCSWGGDDARRVEMMNDQVVSIGDIPPAGATTPDSVFREMETAYGPPAFTRHGENTAFPYRAFWVGADSASQLELSCPSATEAAGCRLITRRSSPREIRRAAGNAGG